MEDVFYDLDFPMMRLGTADVPIPFSPALEFPIIPDVKKIYEIFDVQLPRSAREQFRVGSQIKKEELAVGDLVFFKTKRYVKYPTHVGIYIGDGNFIHSSSGHGRIGVKIDALSSDYYTKAFTGATRIKDGLFEERSDATSTKTSNNM